MLEVCAGNGYVSRMIREVLPSEFSLRSTDALDQRTSEVECLCGDTAVDMCGADAFSLLMIHPSPELEGCGVVVKKQLVPGRYSCMLPSTTTDCTRILSVKHNRLLIDDPISASSLHTLARIRLSSMHAIGMHLDAATQTRLFGRRLYLPGRDAKTMRVHARSTALCDAHDVVDALKEVACSDVRRKQLETLRSHLLSADRLLGQQQLRNAGDAKLVAGLDKVDF